MRQSKELTLERLRSARLGLALGSGAARGFAHLGFLEEFAEAGLRPACLSGCSAGAFVGAAYAGGDWEGFVRRALSMQWRDLLGLVDPVLPRSGLLKGEGALEFLAGFLRVENLEDCSPPLAVNATDAVTGEEVIFDRGPIIPAVRASIALPGMFNPVRQGERLLLDGGLVNPLPVNLCRLMGAEVIVAVDINAQVLDTGPGRAGGNASVDGMAGGWPGKVRDMIRKVLIRKVLEKQPLLALLAWYLGRDAEGGGNGAAIRGLGLLEVLVNSIYIMQRALNRMHLEREAPDVLIAPELREYRSLDFLKGRACAEAGAVAARRFLESLPDWREP